MVDETAFPRIAAALSAPAPFPSLPARSARLPASQTVSPLIVVARRPGLIWASLEDVAKALSLDFTGQIVELSGYRCISVELACLAELDGHLREPMPTLVVVDTALLDPLDDPLVKRWHKRAPDLLWLVAYHEPSDDVFRLATRICARGCLGWHCGGEQLVRAITAVVRGDLWFPRPMLQSLYLEHIGRRSPSSAVVERRAEASAAPKDLTKREAEILALVRQGLSNKQISVRLGVSVSTVKRHPEHTFEKCGFQNRRQMVF